MNVLIIPEDFRKDQFILKPIVKSMLAAMGKSNANIQICLDPLLGGVREALKWDRVFEIIGMYRGMIDIFLLIVDRDGDINRRTALDRIEQNAAAAIPADRLFLSENAWQEIEVWILAGHDLPNEWRWQDIRNEVHPKEVYFEPFAKQQNVNMGPGGGRKTLAEEAARNYKSIQSRCKEDIGVLEKRLKEYFSKS